MSDEPANCSQVATPSQQTNQILDLLSQLSSNSDANWKELLELLERRLEGQRRSREEFEAKARSRGEAFFETAQPRLELVQNSFEAYADCLQQVHQAVLAHDPGARELGKQLSLVTQRLFESLDAYAAFYFAWGETQSPLVTMIRQAVESYSRSALQSTQAQRILQDMQQHLSSTEENQQPRNEDCAPGSGQ